MGGARAYHSKLPVLDDIAHGGGTCPFEPFGRSRKARSGTLYRKAKIFLCVRQEEAVLYQATAANRTLHGWPSESWCPGDLTGRVDKSMLAVRISAGSKH